MATFTGTPGDDVFEGGSADDVASGGGGNDSLIGGAGDDKLYGGPGNDFHDGGSFNDTMKGATGDDTYVVRGSFDKVIEESGEGTDTVQSTISYRLPSHVENLVLIAPSWFNAPNGTGNSLANNIVGTDHGNTLDGARGADVLHGRGGNDIYIVDNSGDQVVELSGEGTDEVQSSVSFRLADNVENLVLTGTAAISGIGNNADNRITGNGAPNFLSGGGGNDRIDGGSGADDMRGGAGGDTYIVDDSGDRIMEESGAGTDLIVSYISYVLPDHVESLALGGGDFIDATGNRLDNQIFGNGKSNRLDGAAGADTMAGGDGHDIYVVDNVGDQVVEDADEGTDTVRSYVTYTLPDHVEALALGGVGFTDATGNELANRLYGNARGNTLDGAGGADTLSGRDGHDTYVVDDAGDRIVEGTDEGVDTVKSSVSYGLIPNIENLYLTGTAAIDGTGNAAANRLVGNSAANTLDGARGADRMEGRFGNDSYIVDHPYDTVIELANEGTDRVRSSIDYALPDHVEILILEGNAAIDGLGNALANQLVGNRQKNTLDGGAGADAMQGGFGNDTYVVDDAGDEVIELANEGADRVKSAIDYRLGDHVENLYLSGREDIDGAGNALANKIVGNRGSNRLEGEGGADLLIGGDRYDRLFGGEGNDRLEGGLHADRFYFDTALGSGNVDTILDFAPGEDKILLDDAIFRALPAGALADDALAIGSAATSAVHRIVYNPSTGALLYDADGDGGAAAVQFAMLANNASSLAASDFLVI
jgi:Ca2+-binding RTX toxin-like protein